MTSYFPYPHPTTTSYPAPPEPPRRRLGTGLVAITAAVALLAGGAGAALGVSLADGPASVTTAGGTTTQTVLSPSDEDTVASVAAAVTPSVVTINVRGASAAGSGSGVILTSDGTILTNNHVVAAAQGGSISVEFSDGTQAAATVVGTDPSTDIAVIQAENVSGLRAASFADSDEVVVGELVIAIGSPLGLDGTVTSGVVSAVDRPVRTGDTDSQAVIDAIQTDAAINPGNSGGALVDSSGAVVGINTAIRTLGGGEGGGSIGLGFAIPIDDARVIAEELIRSGRVRHPDLGVNAASVTDGVSDGARVQNVQQGSAAAEAGIVEGDVIVRVGERGVATADELEVAVREFEIGAPVPVALVRDNRPLTVTVMLKSD